MSEELVLKWGIISVGLISQDFCTALLTLNQSDKHKLQACAARDINHARAFADRFEIPSFYDSYDSVIADPNVNIVYIGK